MPGLRPTRFIESGNTKHVDWRQVTFRFGFVSKSLWKFKIITKIHYQNMLQVGNSEQEGTAAKTLFFLFFLFIFMLSTIITFSKSEQEGSCMFSCWHSKRMANEYQIQLYKINWFKKKYF